MATAADVTHRLRLWWRRRSRVNAAGALTLVLLSLALVLLSLALVLILTSWDRESVLDGSLPSSSSDPVLVDLTLLKNAEEKGALCLDGSPPGYHLQKGTGSGSDSWLIHLEGGGWCRNLAACSARKHTALGSSHYMERQIAFYGILSNAKSQNPDFYNWNKVKVRYCDGASFSGNIDNELQNGEKIFFRGQRIWKAIMDELLVKGLANAKQALLTGCSAGGLATYIHCDDFRASLPKEVTVKCLADGGFFLDEKDIGGERTIQSFYNEVVHLQDVGKRFPSCASVMEPSQCFFPREIIKNIKTPVFILNPAYDAWQIQHILAPETSDPQRSWLSCKLNIRNCNANQIASLQGFREAFLDSLSEVKHKREWGMFITSCFVHCQTINNITWHSPHSPRINNKTIAEAVGDWYFDRREVKEIDCAYPCNPTCYNLVFAKPYKL